MPLSIPDLVVKPFANTGMKATPPQTDPNGFVNFTDGYTADYEIDIESGNPQAKGVELGVQNYLFNQSTMAIQAWQQAGYSPWFSTMPNGYQLNAFVIRQNGTNAPWLPYRSLTANNVSDPLNSATWEYVQGAAEMIKNIPMPSGGTGGPSTALITAATNFNTFTAAGTWEFQTDAIVTASNNSPSSSFTGAAAGLLEVMPIVSTGGTTYILQRYFDRNGVLYTRASTNGAWSAWNVMPNLTQVSAGRYAGLSSYNANQTIAVSQGGYAIQWYGGAGGTLTLPVGSTLPVAIPYTFFNEGTAPVTVTVNPGPTTPADFINTGGAGKIASVVLQVGDTLQVTSRGTGEWDVTGGTAGMQFVVNPQFIGTANFAARPVFNGQTPWDSSNLPSPFQTTGGTVTGATTFTGGVTFNTTVTMNATNILKFNAVNGGTYTGQMRADGATQSVGFINQAGTGFTFRVSDAGAIFVQGGGSFGARPTFAGAVPWDTANLPSPIQTTGGAFSGQVDHNANIRMLNGSQIWMWGPGNGSYGVFAGYAGGMGFLNQAQTAWNMQMSDGGIMSLRNRPTWGATPWDSANFNPAAYQPAGNYTVNSGNNNTAGMRFQSGSPPSMGSASFGQTALQIANAGNNSASAIMTFIRDGNFGAMFGIDTDNQLKYGGGSTGVYRIWHEGNITPATASAQVQWGSGISELAGVVTGADVTVDAGGPWVLEGLRTNGGNNRIFMRVVWLRNQ